MSYYPPLSAASHAVVQSVIAKVVEIQSSGDMSAIGDGYRACSALVLRSALQLAGHGANVRAEDILDNIIAMADNMDPKRTPKEQAKAKADHLLETLEDYTDNEYEADRAIQSLRNIIAELTKEE